PIELRLVGLDGTEKTISLDANQCKMLLTEAKKLVGEINAIIESKTDFGSMLKMLATPSGENCKFCQYRYVCSIYSDASSNTAATHEWPLDLRGEIRQKIMLGNGKMLIEMILLNGSAVGVRG